MLDMRRAGGKAKDIAQQRITAERPGGQAAFGLNDHHQIGWVGRVIMPPDIALQRFGAKEVGHA